jgi:diadenosine tetraphosphate (Ap4A) HIT family hydrolase
MPRERWEALVRGEECPLCAEVRAADGASEHGYFVTDLPFTRLRIEADQHVPGYCVLICKKHVREPHELDEAERAAFFADMLRVGEALERLYGAVKINYSILGNAVPHLHCHIQPRFYGDPHPGQPVWGAQPERLAPKEYRERIGAIRDALGGG